MLDSHSVQDGIIPDVAGKPEQKQKGNVAPNRRRAPAVVKKPEIAQKYLLYTNVLRASGNLLTLSAGSCRIGRPKSELKQY
jgi:hypothetical protein